MELVCQQNAIDELKHLSEVRCQNVLIQGISGCGKSYLVNRYANMLNVSDCIFVEPNVSDIRNAIIECTKLSYDVVVAIENLDCGVNKSAYTLLKFLEEPDSNVYIVITCRNIQDMPDTILSRSVVVDVNHPTPDDTLRYAQKIDLNRYNIISSRKLWNIVHTLTDVDMLYSLSLKEIDYIESEFPKLMDFKDSISNLMWKFTHYDEGEIDLDLVFRYLISQIKDRYIQNVALQCARDINRGTLAAHAVFGKFLIEAKYGG